MLAEELGWELKAFRKAFRECFDEGLIKTSPDYSKDRIIFIPNFLKINFPQNPNVVRSWDNVWRLIPECQLKLEVWHHIKNIMESKDKESKAWSKAFIETCQKPSLKPSRKPFCNPLGNLSPNQEQEQEQEQEVKTPPTPQGDVSVEKTGGESKRRTVPGYSPEFETFWTAYPRKEAKGSAFKAWQKQKPPLSACLSALAWQKKSDQWTKDAGSFIPHPASWINARRWEDEPVPAVSTPTHPVFVW